MLRIGLTGGIGSGKSTVSRVFGTIGIPVYNSDLRGRILSNSSEEIRQQVTELLGADAYLNGKMDRPYIASIVFSDRKKLAGLNSVIHPVVMDDFDAWAAQMENCGHKYVVQENAILFEAGFDNAIDYSITISTPVAVRVRRASRRDNLDERAVMERIANQMDDPEREKRADFIIYNDDNDLVVPEVIRLHQYFTSATDEK